MIYLVIYIIGFFVSLLIWAKFGKKYWTDYDQNDEYGDDWSSNSQAYTAFSLAWPLFFIFVTLAGTWKVLTSVANFLINKFNENDNNRSTENVEEDRAQ